ncbi:NAC domain-containing protein 71-like [Lycium barbarum]|uniref:NAC domain-containing protein 71-like n=1 Tax=Lycium barbarum TaxID=112863 RepID=UPI00293F2613|nr:NAC domain-containing protein 71-like [Lycium barbarum]
MENQEILLLPGFIFKPNDEQLVGFYLKNKVNSEYHGDVIPDIDLRMEPWDIKDALVAYEGQEKWYYFGRINRKYATGPKINRTTEAGYWKASGADTAVVSKNGEKIGIKRTLVFYERRAPDQPKGKRTNWTTYEYRLLTSQHGPSDQPQEYQEWVVYKGLQKSPNPSNPSSTMHHNDPPNPVFNQTSSFNQFTFNPSHPDQDILISSQIGFENQLVDELPQLRGIPNTSSTMFGTAQDLGLCVQSSISYDMSANNAEERSRPFTIDPATSSYSFHNFQLPITSTSDYYQNHMSQMPVPEGYPTTYTYDDDQNHMSQMPVPEGYPTTYTYDYDQNHMSQMPVPEGYPTTYI